MQCMSMVSEVLAVSMVSEVPGVSKVSEVPEVSMRCLQSEMPVPTNRCVHVRVHLLEHVYQEHYKPNDKCCSIWEQLICWMLPLALHSHTFNYLHPFHAFCVIPVLAAKQHPTSNDAKRY